MSALENASSTVGDFVEVDVMKLTFKESARLNRRAGIWKANVANFRFRETRALDDFDTGWNCVISFVANIWSGSNVAGTVERQTRLLISGYLHRGSCTSVSFENERGNNTRLNKRN